MKISKLTTVTMANMCCFQLECICSVKFLLQQFQKFHYWGPDLTLSTQENQPVRKLKAEIVVEWWWWQWVSSWCINESCLGPWMYWRHQWMLVWKISWVILSFLKNCWKNVLCFWTEQRSTLIPLIVHVSGSWVVL